jgi:hypothetical protein
LGDAGVACACLARGLRHDRGAPGRGDGDGRILREPEGPSGLVSHRVVERAEQDLLVDVGRATLVEGRLVVGEAPGRRRRAARPPAPPVPCPQDHPLFSGRVAFGPAVVERQSCRVRDEPAQVSLADHLSEDIAGDGSAPRQGRGWCARASLDRLDRCGHHDLCRQPPVGWDTLGRHQPAGQFFEGVRSALLGGAGVVLAGGGRQ